MQLSSKLEYALLALMDLADQYDKGKALKIGEIAAHHSLPERYLEQVLSSLRLEGIIQSQRGANGGYMLVREPWQITMLEVVTIIEGDNKPKNGERSEPLCPEKSVVYDIWQEAKEAIQTVFKSYTIQDLCQKRDICQQVNPMYYI